MASINWKCTTCSSFLRCIINKGTIIPIPMTTPLGGEFCSSYCAIAFLETQPDYKPEQISYKKEEENVVIFFT